MGKKEVLIAYNKGVLQQAATIEGDDGTNKTSWQVQL
jgi:hypothetical protein